MRAARSKIMDRLKANSVKRNAKRKASGEQKASNDKHNGKNNLKNNLKNNPNTMATFFDVRLSRLSWTEFHTVQLSDGNIVV